MGQDVKNRSRVCPLPPGPLKDMDRLLKPRTIMAMSLTLILSTTSFVYFLIQPSPIPLPFDPPSFEPPIIVPGTPHGVIWIYGDAIFSDIALLEGWEGDGSPGNPFIIDGLDIDFGDEIGPCIHIGNTRVSFIIRNCRLTRARAFMSSRYDGSGIFLYNVTNGELVNNIVDSNTVGILLEDSTSNSLVNNTCYNNSMSGICLRESDTNTVENNICNNNSMGIRIFESSYNTVTNNNFNNNGGGIRLESSFDIRTMFNTVANNTCNNNSDVGIELVCSDSNTLVNNTCNSNERYGIGLGHSGSNTVANNTCNSNEIGIGLGSWPQDIRPMFNTVANNTCNNNEIGICLEGSSYNTITNNTCNGNDIGIELYETNSNTVSDNTCNSNRIGIYIFDSVSNTLTNNICNNNRIGVFIHDPIMTELLFFLGFAGFIGVTLLGGGWIASKRVSEGE